MRNHCVVAFIIGLFFGGNIAVLLFGLLLSARREGGNDP